MGQDEEEADRIHMTDEWASLLEKYPTKPAKKGRMMYLLKLKSKKTPTMKPRKAYTPLDIIGQLNESKPMTQTLFSQEGLNFSMTPGDGYHLPEVNKKTIIKPVILQKYSKGKKE